LSLSENFVSQVCDAFRKVVAQASGVPSKEGMEREFRRALARHLFDDLLGWEGHSKVGEIIDIEFFDDENFPIIIVETKWGVQLTPEIKEKLRKRIEERGSVKYGVFANERDFVVYAYRDYELKDIAKVNVAVAVGVAKGEYGLSDVEMKNLQRLEALKRERLVWAETPDYFERTYKEVSVTKAEGVKLLTDNLKDIVKDLTAVLVNFFNSYWTRTGYSGKFLQSSFDDWLRLSMKDEEFNKDEEEQKQKIAEMFCRETAYVLVGRILFIRICEDKDVLEQSLSGKRITEFLGFYEKRTENVYLRIFYDSREEIKKYYSHLHELGFFDWWWISPEKLGLLTEDERSAQETLEAELNDKIKKCLRRLNRFDFSHVNKDILGDVYQGYLPADERKRLGEFYTPREVVEYILDILSYKPQNEIRKKKILDPACGSGGFLVEATRRLIECYRRVGFKIEDPVDAKQIIEECVASIFGLDIHPFAVFITEMNLLFQLVELYDSVRKKEKYYTLPRLNIYRTDSLTPLGETMELTGLLNNSRRMVFIEEMKGAEKVKSTTFDFVVGNPPYVRTKKIARDYIDSLMTSYKEIAHGKADLYVYFIFRAIQWIGENGKVGLITSNKFAKAKYGLKLMQYIQKNCWINVFVDFGDSGVFSEVTNYPCIFVLTRKGRETGQTVKFIRIFKPLENVTKTLDHVLDKTSLDRYMDDFIEVFEIKELLIGEEGWIALPEKEKTIFSKIQQNAGSLLENLGKMRMGIHHAPKDVLVLQEETVKKYDIERSYVKPLIEGKDVLKWRTSWRKLYIIFPHEYRNGVLIPVELDRAPNLKRYLEMNRKKLENRKFYRKKITEYGKRWYEIWNPFWFEQPKIITPHISRSNNFTYDEKFYGNVNVYAIIPDNKERSFTMYLLGLLNSKVLEFCFKQISVFVSGRYYLYKHQYLGTLPIKIPTTAEEKRIANRISQMVEEILLLYQQVTSIREKIANFPEGLCQRYMGFRYAEKYS